MKYVKKILSVLLSLTIIAGSLAFAPCYVNASSNTETIDGIIYSYSTNNNAAEITQCNPKPAGNYTVPHSLGGYPVEKIGSRVFSDASELTSVIIPDSVTYIDYEAFSDCGNLTNITMGNGVEHIGYEAFRGCTNLTGLTIGNGVTNIGNGAFMNCKGLTSITIPDNVTSIAEWAFEGCEGLTKVTVSGNVKSMGAYVFYGCSKLKTAGPIGGGYDFEFAWNDRIPSCAFDGCSSLTSITIPDNLKSIGSCAFRGTVIYSDESNWENGVLYYNNYLLSAKNEALEDLSIKQGTTVIADNVFSQFKNLLNVTIPDSVTHIGEMAFSDCKNLVNVSIGNGVKSIGKDAFLNCMQIKNITIPNSVHELSGFSGCTGLTSFVIPDSVTSIGAKAFSDCTGLKGVSVSSNVANIGENAFFGCSSITGITIPNSVTDIGNEAFKNCTSLISISIPDSVISIGSSIFYGCENLTTVSIGSGITSIGYDWFKGCSNLENIKLGDNIKEIQLDYFSTESTFYGTKYYNDPSNWEDGVLYIGNYLIKASSSDCIGRYCVKPSTTFIPKYAFYGCKNLKEIVIPDSVKRIYDLAFISSGLSSVTISSDDIEIGMNPFAYCSHLDEINVDADNESLRVIDNYLVSIKSGTLITSFGSLDNLPDIIDETIIEKYFCTSIPNIVSIIGDYALAGKHYYNIILPNTVTSIGKFAFAQCYNLDSMVLPEGLKSIGINAFYGCSQMQSVLIPDSVECIGSCAFEECGSLLDVKVPDSIERVDNFAFGYVPNVEYTGTLSEAPWGAKTLNGYVEGFVVFKDSEKKEITACSKSIRGEYIIPDSVNYISNYAFEGCRWLTAITIPSSILYSYYFDRCTDLQFATIETEKIRDHAFYMCTSLTGIALSNNVKTIEYAAFKDCNIKDVFYQGTINEWNSVKVNYYDNGNDCLKHAKIHCTDGIITTTVSSEIKVMSYNVYSKNDVVEDKDDGTEYDCHYSKRAEYLVKNMMMYRPDSIGFQEMTEDLLEKINNTSYGGVKFSDIYDTTVGEYRGGGDKPNEASKIAFRKDKYTKKDEGTWWLSVDGKKGTKFPGANYVRIYTWVLLEDIQTKQQYLHINTHMDHDDDAAEFSAYEINNFVNASYPDTPVVLTGDFNHKTDSRAYQRFTSAGFVDANVNNDKTYTYTNYYNVKNGGKKNIIDYILVKNGLEDGINNYSVIDNDYSDSGLSYSYPSDHHPIMASLTFTYRDTAMVANTTYTTGSGHSSTNEVRYDSEWLSYDNKNYNHDLARFCSDFAMMAYTDDVNELKNNLAQFGFENAEIDLATGKKEDPGRDQVNYFIADKKEVTDGDEYTVIFAGFIGSNGYQWYSNFDPYGTERKNSYAGDSEKDKVHLGFADARDFALEKLQTHINALGTDRNKIKLIITGHSRGAAAANLLSAKIADNNIVPIDDIYTYTFATPNTINIPKIAGVFDENNNWNWTSVSEIMENSSNFKERYAYIFNIVNPEDFVTKVLLTDWGYGRYGQTITLPSKTNDKYFNANKDINTQVVSNNAYYDGNLDYWSYLKSMNDYFNKFTGDRYASYPDGEHSVYSLIKKMSNRISGLGEYYSKDDLYGGGTLFEYFKNVVCPFAAGLKDWNTFAATAASLASVGTLKSAITFFLIEYQATAHFFEKSHQMETYCAYMNSMGSGWLRRHREAYQNTVNCPVDIEVYDNETNELVGKITNNVIDETVAAKENAVVMTVDGDSKEFWLPSNGDYRVVLTGNDNGIMDYTVSQIDSDLGETERVNFFDVDIEKGVSMVGEFSDGLLNVEDYKLRLSDNTELKPDEKVENGSNSFNINVTADGPGYASSSQTAVSGDYVSLLAEAQEGASFLGWYDNGELISTEAELSFVAKSSRDLIAKFENKTSPEGPVKPEEPTNPEDPTTPDEKSTKPDFSGFKIKNYSSTLSVDYKSTVIFHTAMDAPEGYEIVWSNNAKGSECKLNSVTKKEYKVSAKMVNKTTGETVQTTEEVTVKVSATFIAKIIAFFKGLFNMLPTYEDFKKQ